MNSRDYQERAREAQDKAWAATSEDLRARWLVVAQHGFSWQVKTPNDGVVLQAAFWGVMSCDAHFAVSLKLGG